MLVFGTEREVEGMKFFRVVSKEKDHIYGEIVIPGEVAVEPDPEAVRYLLDENEEGVYMSNFRQAVAWLADPEIFRHFDLVGRLRCMNPEQQMMTLDILEHCRTKYGNAHLYIKEDVGIRVIKKFFPDYAEESGIDERFPDL